jgi:hypothetical protein
LSVPADTFQIGDSYHFKIGGILTADGTGGTPTEINFKIKNGLNVIAESGAIEFNSVSGTGWEIELDFTISQIGSRGVLFTNGDLSYIEDGAQELSGFVFESKLPIDTTVDSVLDVTAEFVTINTGDSIQSVNAVLYKTY